MVRLNQISSKGTSANVRHRRVVRGLPGSVHVPRRELERDATAVVTDRLQLAYRSPFRAWYLRASVRPAPRLEFGGAAGNLLSYAILLCSGGFLLPGQLPAVEWVGRILPISHGPSAIRAGIAGEPRFGELALELLAGGCWFALAAVVVADQVRRARRSGRDDS